MHVRCIDRDQTRTTARVDGRADESGKHYLGEVGSAISPIDCSLSFTPTPIPTPAPTPNLTRAPTPSSNDTVLEAAPATCPLPATATTDTLTLRTSEDAYLSDALFTASVNGHQVGGTMAPSALHGAGDSNAFTLPGDWARALRFKSNS